MENHTSTLGLPIAGVVKLRLTKHMLYSPQAAAYVGVLDRNPRLSETAIMFPVKTFCLNGP
ncbi:hypothetical protein [Peribacillus simplex]|uniref:hypothetical protein n=1 Tax=Peribacillus simplex TaxID=1478 RepID=UPI00366F45DA